MKKTLVLLLALSMVFTPILSVSAAPSFMPTVSSVVEFAETVDQTPEADVALADDSVTAVNTLFNMDFNGDYPNAVASDYFQTATFLTGWNGDCTQRIANTFTVSDGKAIFTETSTASDAGSKVNMATIEVAVPNIKVSDITKVDIKYTIKNADGTEMATSGMYNFKFNYSTTAGPVTGATEYNQPAGVTFSAGSVTMDHVAYGAFANVQDEYLTSVGFRLGGQNNAAFPYGSMKTIEIDYIKIYGTGEEAEEFAPHVETTLFNIDFNNAPANVVASDYFETTAFTTGWSADCTERVTNTFAVSDGKAIFTDATASGGNKMNMATISVAVPNIKVSDITKVDIKYTIKNADGTEMATSGMYNFKFNYSTTAGPVTGSTLYNTPAGVTFSSGSVIMDHVANGAFASVQDEYLTSVGFRLGGQDGQAGWSYGSMQTFEIDYIKIYGYGDTAEEFIPEVEVEPEEPTINTLFNIDFNNAPEGVVASDYFETATFTTGWSADCTERVTNTFAVSDGKAIFTDATVSGGNRMNMATISVAVHNIKVSDITQVEIKYTVKNADGTAMATSGMYNFKFNYATTAGAVTGSTLYNTPAGVTFSSGSVIMDHVANGAFASVQDEYLTSVGFRLGGQDGQAGWSYGSMATFEIDCIKIYGYGDAVEEFIPEVEVEPEEPTINTLFNIDFNNAPEGVVASDYFETATFLTGWNGDCTQRITNTFVVSDGKAIFTETSTASDAGSKVNMATISVAVPNIKVSDITKVDIKYTSKNASGTAMATSGMYNFKFNYATSTAGAVTGTTEYNAPNGVTFSNGSITMDHVAYGAFANVQDDYLTSVGFRLGGQNNTAFPHGSMQTIEIDYIKIYGYGDAAEEFIPEVEVEPVETTLFNIDFNNVPASATGSDYFGKYYEYMNFNSGMVTPDEADVSFANSKFILDTDSSSSTPATSAVGARFGVNVPNIKISDITKIEINVAFRDANGNALLNTSGYHLRYYYTTSAGTSYDSGTLYPTSSGAMGMTFNADSITLNPVSHNVFSGHTDEELTSLSFRLAGNSDAVKGKVESIEVDCIKIYGYGTTAEEFIPTKPYAPTTNTLYELNFNDATGVVNGTDYFSTYKIINHNSAQADPADGETTIADGKLVLDTYAEAYDEASQNRDKAAKGVRFAIDLPNIKISDISKFDIRLAFRDANGALVKATSAWNFRYFNTTAEGNNYNGSASWPSNSGGNGFTIGSDYYTINPMAFTSQFTSTSDHLTSLGFQLMFNDSTDFAKLETVEVYYIKIYGNDADTDEFVVSMDGQEAATSETGIRFKASIAKSFTTGNDSIKEIGWIVGLESAWGTTELTYSNETADRALAEGKSYVEGSAFKIFDEDENGYDYAAIVTGIPEGKESTNVIVRPFVKYDKGYAYGKAVVTSLAAING